MAKRIEPRGLTGFVFRACADGANPAISPLLMLHSRDRGWGRFSARAGVWLCLFTLPAASGQIHLVDDGRLSVSGSSTFRYEYQDSTAAGAFKQERLRLSARVDGHWEARENWTFASGVRTGSLENQQTPTVTIKPLDSRSGYGSRAIYVDRWQAGVAAGKQPGSHRSNNVALLGRRRTRYGTATPTRRDFSVLTGAPRARPPTPSRPPTTGCRTADCTSPGAWQPFSFAVRNLWARDASPTPCSGCRWRANPNARHARARANERDYRIAPNQPDLRGDVDGATGRLWVRCLP